MYGKNLLGIIVEVCAMESVAIITSRDVDCLCLYNKKILRLKRIFRIRRHHIIDQRDYVNSCVSCELRFTLSVLRYFGKRHLRRWSGRSEANNWKTKVKLWQR